MRLIIRDDSASASAFVADYIIDRIKHFAPTPAHPFVLGLPTGSTPLVFYKILVEKYKAGEVFPPPKPLPRPVIKTCVSNSYDSLDLL